IEAVWNAAGVEELTAERQSQGVETETLDLIQHVPPLAHPQSVWTECAGLHAEPVDAGHPDRHAVGVDDLFTVGVPESCPAAGADLRPGGGDPSHWKAGKDNDDRNQRQ